MVIVGVRYIGLMKVVWLLVGREVEWYVGGRCGVGVGDRFLFLVLFCVVLFYFFLIRVSVFLFYLYI